MKTSACLILGLFFSHIAGAQSPVQEVIDNALIQQTSTNTQSIISMLQQQLDEARQQTQSINDQLTRMGDPSQVSLPALEVIKRDIANSIQAADGGASREQRLSNATGIEAFKDNTYGLITTVDPTVTFKTKDEYGNTVETVIAREVSKYKLHGTLMGELDALTDKSKQADERITQLEERRPALLDQLSAATDIATTLKLQAALNTMEAQIASAKADVTKSHQDHEVLMEKLKLQSQIEAIAKAEARTLERKHKSDTAKAKASSSGSSSSSSSSGGSTSPFSNLTWGK